MSPTRTATGLLLLLLSAAPAHAQLRYVAVADAREVYNSNVIDLESAAGNGEKWDLITELEPGIRLYYGRPRSLLSLRYSAELQLFAQTKDPQSGSPLVGYGNRLSFAYTYLLGPRLELAVTNHLAQGTENITQQGSLTGSGAVRPVAPRLAVGARFVSEAASLGLNYFINKNWNLRPLVGTEIYYPYAGPPEDPGGEPGEAGQPGPAPLYSFNLANLVTRSFATSVLMMGLTTSIHSEHLDNRHKLAVGVQEQHLAAFPDNWNTLVLGTTVGWRWQITDFLDTHLGGGFSVARMDRIDTTNQVMVKENMPAPLAEAVIRYRRGQNLSLSLGYSHGWTREPELGLSSTAQTDAATLYGFLGLEDWTFELIGSFLYLNMTSYTGAQGDASKAATGLALISYLLTPGLSIEASYRYDTLFDRVVAQGVASSSQLPPTVDRHVGTLGVSMVWPPPPPQEVRLTRRESEHDPVFTLGQGISASEQRQRDRLQQIRPQQTRRTPAPWERGTRQPGPASLIEPPREEQPPAPGTQDEEDDSGYYSWPR